MSHRHPPDPPAVIAVHFVHPGGVQTVPVETAEGRTELADIRTFTHGLHIHLDAPGSGLIDEMRDRRSPVPWRSAAERLGMLRYLRDRTDLPDDLRRDLLRWVGRSPYYEFDEPAEPAPAPDPLDPMGP
ncbi:MAG: hypothetical protein AAGK21_03960 [Bacteroidota bacterium]